MGVGELSELLRSTSSPIQKILITGASGWIGRETIALLQPILGEEFSHRVTLTGSRDAKIVVSGKSHHIKVLYEIDQDQRFDLVIHLAYLTQEKVDTLGSAEFAQQVRKITSFVYNLCLSTAVPYIFVASSGAADPRVWAEYTNHSKRDYGKLKREAEELFQSLDEAKVEIGRIWSISGSQIQNYQKYALGDFIKQVVEKGNIELESAKRIKRAYVDAGELIEVFIINLLSGGTGIIDSGGFETSLQDLGRLVLNELHPGGKLILPTTVSTSEDDIYVPDVKPFNNLAKHFGVKLSSLEEQIRTTAKAQTFH